MERENNKEVLVMYDIRDIQKYIFNTNKVRDIIGASMLVDNLLEEGLTACKEIYPEIEMEKVFIGGGNASVLYKNSDDASKMNRALAVWVQENTYSLQLAVAAVEKTERYDEDYEKLQQEMAKVKMKMRKTALYGALPIVERESNTGFPLTEIVQGPEQEERVSREVALKRKKLLTVKGQSGIKFDDIVDQKEKDSTLAVVHIDGNNMGKRIKKLMEGEKDYESAKSRMKQISQYINQGFSDAFEEMEKKLYEWAEVTEGESVEKRYIRRIILAGDDITFVCTGKLALSLVEVFVHALKDKVLFAAGEDEIKNLEENGFSVCAGIAYMHSHFPFSEAYRIAESCCENAKKMAKEESAKVEGIIGSWVDFQMCKNVQMVYLHDQREKNYRLENREYLLKRPYYIPYIEENASKLQKMNEKNEKFSIEHLKNQLQYLLSEKDENGSGMTKSDLKKLRNTYSMGEEALEALLVFFKSRGKMLNESVFDENGVANWYDALEIFELFTDIEAKVKEEEEHAV